MKHEFEITTSQVNSYLGLEIERDRTSKKTWIHQTAYTKSILKKFGIENCNEIAIPAETNVIFRRMSGECQQ